jgi:hypothetical protein
MFKIRWAAFVRQTASTTDVKFPALHLANVRTDTSGLLLEGSSE